MFEVWDRCIIVRSDLEIRVAGKQKGKEERERDGYD
jgi:hypothetical protein